MSETAVRETTTWRVKERHGCRSCGGLLGEVLDLGMHVVNGFQPKGADWGEKVPLRLCRCLSCHLVQLKDTVNPDLLYRDYYYRSGINEVMREALADIAHAAERLVPPTEGDVVLDIGGNDGTLLQQYHAGQIRRVNFDPSNVAASTGDGLSRPVDTFAHYFSAERFEDAAGIFGYPKPKVMTAIAMLYGLDDPHTFLADVAKVLHPEGIFVVQMSYLAAMIETGAYDVICHEHLETWSTATFAECLMPHGLEIQSVEYNSINGGSARYIITHRSAPLELRDRIAREGHRWVRAVKIERPQDSAFRLRQFAYDAVQHRYKLLGYLTHLKHQGKIVHGLGASTKANTLYQYCGIGPDLVQFIVDRDPCKQGRFTPTGQEILLEETCDFDHPRTVFLVNIWQFLPMLRERYAPRLAAGADFLVPFPDVHLESQG